MSPSAASRLAKAGSFFSSPGWKRVFSRHRMSPFFIAATAARRLGPMQSSAKATGRLTTRATSAATGRSEYFGSGPFGAAEMRQQDHLAALVGDLGDGRRDSLDAGRVRDLAVLHRHVEIDAHQHALALEVGVIEGAEALHDALRLRATAIGVRSACPSPPRCRPCGWRSPTRCRTRTSRARTCRPSPWSGPCGRSTNADRG